ncbi:MAG: alanine racemase domain protein [Bacteriovoracaceae bacterium]|nr:alanine racemase domain protein [Bacteriovoracaceae bacterium]
MTLFQTLESIRKRVKEASQRSPFGVKPIMLMGVSKGQPLNSVRSAAEIGLLDLGENYAQELLSKAPLCTEFPIRWHFIGKVQSNKIKYILPHISSICSVDSIEIADRIARVRDQLEIERPPIPILLQVNLGNDPHRAGLQPEVLDGIFERFLNVQGVSVSGLMAIPPFVRNVKLVRPYFKTMKELFDKLQQRHPNPERFQVLSMGMSRDFEEAIEEGSTCVRVGEAIFGPRPVVKKT